MYIVLLVGIIIAIVYAFNSGSASSNNFKNSQHHGYYKTGCHASSTYCRKSVSVKNSNKYNIQSREMLEERRREFEEMKQTEFFKRWRKAQYECQGGKCAYCLKCIELYSSNTQVDHVRPLCKCGTNEYSNLVLACRSCNYFCKKGDYTWRDENGRVHSGWIKPAWIRNNPVLDNTKKCS